MDRSLSPFCAPGDAGGLQYEKYLFCLILSFCLKAGMILLMLVPSGFLGWYTTTLKQKAGRTCSKGTCKVYADSSGQGLRSAMEAHQHLSRNYFGRPAVRTFSGMPVRLGGRHRSFKRSQWRC